MTVQKLIEQLCQLPPDAWVYFTDDEMFTEVGSVTTEAATGLPHDVMVIVGPEP